MVLPSCSQNGSPTDSPVGPPPIPGPVDVVAEVAWEVPLACAAAPTPASETVSGRTAATANHHLCLIPCPSGVPNPTAAGRAQPPATMSVNCQEDAIGFCFKKAVPNRSSFVTDKLPNRRGLRS